MHYEAYQLSKQSNSKILDLLKILQLQKFFFKVYVLKNQRNNEYVQLFLNRLNKGLNHGT